MTFLTWYHIIEEIDRQKEYSSMTKISMRTRHLVLSGLFLAMGIILPFFTGQIPQIGSMLLPMHIPVLFCGLICGWQYGALIGFVLPILRFVLFGMPPIYPTGVAMAFELATYGLVIGLCYKHLPKNIKGQYISLAAAMILGRVVWGGVSAMLYGLGIAGLAGKAFTWKMFAMGAVVNAIPGIVLQLVLIPAVMTAFAKTGDGFREEREEIKALVKKQLELYPKSEAVDLLKMLYQNEFGPGHLITDPVKSLHFLEEEAEALSGKNSKVNTVEPIGNGMCRLHLQVLREGKLETTTFERFFELSAVHLRGSRAGFLQKASVLETLCRNKSVKMKEGAVKEALVQWEASGSGLFRHSETFRNTYAPAYRVVEKQFCDYLELFAQIDDFLKYHTSLIVGIDGRCSSGKTTLGALLSWVYGCQCISMDHFFLRGEQRTEERLAQPGGNIDYERFETEVMEPLERGKDFSYRPYDCERGTLGEPIRVKAAKLLVIEGSYSQHPKFAKLYGLTVFLTVSSPEQLRRLKIRSSEQVERFKEEWIPMEEKYFKMYHTQEKSSLCFDTSIDKTLSSSLK
jgi:uridine kinase/riboflavin transporter FmnP